MGNTELQLTKDVKKAINYLQRAAKLENSEALCSLGLLFKYFLKKHIRTGDTGVSQDHVIMMQCLSMASDLNNGYANYVLGLMFLNGRYLLIETLVMDKSKTIKNPLAT